MEVVKMTNVVAQDYGVTETKAAEISKLFQPMLETMKSFEERFNGIVKMTHTTARAADAKVLLKEYVKVRTGTAEIHKEMKAFYLQGGRLVDGWKNAQLMAGRSHEAKLKEIVDHDKIIEEQRLEDLQAVRFRQCLDFVYFKNEIPLNLCLMTESFFNAFLSGLEQQSIQREKDKEEQEENARQLENERIEAELLQQKKEAERLALARKRARKAEAEAAKVRAEAAKQLIEAQKKEKALKIAADLEAEKQRKIQQAKQDKLKAEADKLRQAEQQRQAELIRIENAKQVEFDRLQNAKFSGNDKARLKDFNDHLRVLIIPTMLSDKGQTLAKHIAKELNSLYKYIGANLD